MAKQRRAAPSEVVKAVANGQKSVNTEDLDEEEYRKRFEPVAPWNRENIPDYGPVQDRTQLAIFFVIGVVATLGYEYTDYFDQVSRWLAYLAIWFPLWFRLLTRVSPQLTEEDMDEKEKLDFQAELARIQKEAEVLDD